MTPQQFVEFWDDYVERWHSDMLQHHKRSLETWENFFQQYPFDITELMYYRYFPEPYFGNPASEKLKVVFINLNPGQGGKEQDFHPRGKVLSVYGGSNQKYHTLMRVLIHYAKQKKYHFVLGPTLKWWVNNRVDWVNKTFREANDTPATLDDILGLELTPWHTKSFSEIASTLNAADLSQYVFKPAANISKNVVNEYLCSGGASIVIGRGLQSVLAVRDTLEFRPCTTALPDSLNEKWNVRRAMLDESTILIDFTKKKGGFGMKLPTCPEMRIFFANELTTL